MNRLQLGRGGLCYADRELFITLTAIRRNNAGRKMPGQFDGQRSFTNRSGPCYDDTGLFNG